MNSPDPRVTAPTLPPTPPAATPAPAATPGASDASNLDTLGILYYVLGGITAVFSLIPVAHITIGLAMINDSFVSSAQPGQAPPAALGWMFFVIGLVCLLCGMACAAVFALAGRRMRQRRSYLLCMVVAGLSCAFMPFGTILGVFALIALTKPQVKQLFGPAR